MQGTGLPCPLFLLYDGGVDLHEKIFFALERVHMATRSALQRTVHQQGMSPLQAQILCYLYQNESVCVSQLAEHFGLSKPTVSDAVGTLISKNMLEKKANPLDGRSFDLVLTSKGQEEAVLIAQYAAPFLESVAELTGEQQEALWDALLNLVRVMEGQAMIPHQRICFTCEHFSRDHLPEGGYYCCLMESPLSIAALRADCAEHRRILSS